MSRNFSGSCKRTWTKWLERTTLLNLLLPGSLQNGWMDVKVGQQQKSRVPSKRSGSGVSNCSPSDEHDCAQDISWQSAPLIKIILLPKETFGHGCGHEKRSCSHQCCQVWSFGNQDYLNVMPSCQCLSHK